MKDEKVIPFERPEDSRVPSTELAQAQQRIERLLRENRALQRDKENLNSLIKDLLGSASWKITKPLRDILAVKRKVAPLAWPLLRFGTWTPQVTRPERDLTSTPTGYTISGPSPVLILESPQSKLPSGWATVSLRLQTNKGHLFCYLYFIRGGTASEHDRILLPAVNNELLHVRCRIPYDVTALRLQPFSDDGEFALEHFAIRSHGSLQIAASLLAKGIGYFVRNPRRALRKITKAVAIFREGGIVALRHKLFAKQANSNYEEWVERYDTLSDADVTAIKKRIEKLAIQPTISVVMPVYNVEERWLRAAIESVRGQLYPKWELCIADDASTEPHVRKVLAEYAALDPRIKVTYLTQNGHISKASNKALELVTGEYVALLDNDDELTSHALYMVVEELNTCPDAEFIYSDEDKKTSFGARFNPYFKSGWNPVLLLAQNYLCHLCVYKTSRIKEVGGFRVGYEGAQDWDLALRVTDLLDDSKIRHIPHILYHWRVIEGSTAQSTGYKPYVLEAQRRSVADHLERAGIKGAEVEILEGISQLRVKLPIPAQQPLVSIIIPTRNRVDLLRRCIGSILKKTTYKNFEIVIADNDSDDPETLDYFTEVTQDARVRIVEEKGPFNYAAINNHAVAATKGEFVAFLNNDLEVITPEWLSELVSYAVLEKFGCVGSRLYYPNDTVQHAGVILGINGVAGHNHKGIERGDPGYFNRAILPQNLSAVTAACMVVRREIFESVGGFDEENLAVAFNDVDLCLRIREKGFLNVFAAYSELYHFESASRGFETTPEKFMRFEKEVETMKTRWGAALSQDPFYNPNLTLLTEDFRFAFPPRAFKPWMG